MPLVSVEYVSEAATLLFGAYAIHILVALIGASAYYYAYTKYKKGKNVLGITLILLSMAFDSAWSYYFVRKMYLGDTISAYSMLVPQIIYIFVIACFLIVTFMKPED